MYLPIFRTYYAERKVNHAYDPPLDWKHIRVVIFMLVIYYIYIYINGSYACEYCFLKLHL